MKITYLLKRAVCAVTCCGILTASAVWPVNQTVSADDAPYSIVLSMDTIEINKDSLPENGMVDVKLNIENNPGFSEMYIMIQKSNNLSFYYPSSPASASGKYSGIKNELLNEDVVFLTVPSYSTNTESGTFATVRVKLPGSVNPGDFYEINYIECYQFSEQGILKEAGILKDKTLTGTNSFSHMQSGGIKIVETPATEPPHNDTSADKSSNDNNQPSQEEQQTQPDQDNNQPQAEQTQSPQTEYETTQVTGTEQTTIPVTALPSENAAVVKGTTVKNTTQEVTSSQTEKSDIMDGVVASSDSIEMKPDRTIETVLIIAIIIVSALGIVTFIGLFKYYRKKYNK